MRTLFTLALAALVFAAAAPARADLFGDFNGKANSGTIKPFALDLGGILGAASAPTGKDLGFPGFEAGIVGGAQFRPDRNDEIMRGADVKAFGVPLAQVGVGLPARVDVLAHGIKVGATSIYGGGARYGVIQAGTFTPFMPSVDVSAFDDAISQTYFTANHVAASAGLTWTMIPVVHPFVNAGYDSTHLKVKQAELASIVGQTTTANGSRVAVGLDIVPLPLLHVKAAYAQLHGLPGAELGIGFVF